MKTAFLALLTSLASAFAATPASAAPWPEDSLYQLDGDWRDQDGKSSRMAALAGRPILLAFFYATCDTVCPMTVASLGKLGRALEKDGRKVTYVLVSLTPGRDTPAALAEYAATHKLDAASWRLLTGNEPALKEITAVLDVRYREAPNGVVAHSGGIFAVDAQGVVVAKDLTADDAERALRAFGAR